MDDLLKYLEVLNEARRELRDLLARGDDAAQGRLRCVSTCSSISVTNFTIRDLLYLDLALVNATRTLVESKLDVLRAASANPAYLVPLLICVALFVEGVAMSMGGNQELVCCLRELQAIQVRWVVDDTC